VDSFNTKNPSQLTLTRFSSSANLRKPFFIMHMCYIYRILHSITRLTCYRSWADAICGSKANYCI